MIQTQGLHGEDSSYGKRGDKRITEGYLRDSMLEVILGIITVTNALRYRVAAGQRWLELYFILSGRTAVFKCFWVRTDQASVSTARMEI